MSAGLPKITLTFSLKPFLLFTASHSSMAMKVLP
jgi:hypothetical protein